MLADALSDLTALTTCSSRWCKQPLCLRGVGSSEITNLSPLVDSFRYLRDDFPELAALTQLLQSFFCSDSRSQRARLRRLATSVHGRRYRKLSLLGARWDVETMHAGDEMREKEEVAIWWVEMVDDPHDDWGIVFANGAATLGSTAEASFESVKIAMHTVAMPSQVEDNEVAYVAARLTVHLVDHAALLCRISSHWA